MAKEEEVAEVEEVEAIEDDDDDSYKSMKSKRRSKSRDEEDDEDEEERPSRLKAILAIIAVIIIILAIFLAYFFWAMPIKEIKLDPPQPSTTGDGITITVHTIMEGGSSASGDGDLEIFYDNERVYSDTIKINNDEGTKTIKYEDFVIGNSEYSAKVSFRGKSVTETFNLQKSPFGWTVVENIEIEPSLYPTSLSETLGNSDVKLNAMLNAIDDDGDYPEAHAGKSNVELNIRHESGVEQTYTKGIEEEFGILFDDYNYLSTGSGNYTFTVTWENLWTKSDSIYREIELETPLVKYYNMQIIADAGEVTKTVTIGILGGDEEVEFDASNSINDGEIIAYQWDFEYDEETLEFTVDEVGETVIHTYTSADVGSFYTVALRVIGEGIFGDPDDEWEYEVGFALIEVTVKAGIS